MYLSQTKLITMVRAVSDFTFPSIMPLHLSNNLKECIVQWYYIDRMTMEEIRDLAKCSIGLVYNVIRNYRDFGQVRNPFTHRAGQP